MMAEPTVGVTSMGAHVKELGADAEGDRPSDELLYCVKNYVDLYGDTVDPNELRDSLARGHGLDVSLETVKGTLGILQSKPTIEYGKKYKDYTQHKDAGSPAGADGAADTEEEDTVSINAIEPSQIVSTDAGPVALPGKRKVKLTQDILNTVASTLDEEQEVHSLLSLKRVLERKGIFISKTSVYRALEKLGRSIIEKKKQTRTQRVLVPLRAQPSAAQLKGPLDLSTKASRVSYTDRPLTVAEMLGDKPTKPVVGRTRGRRRGVKRQLAQTPTTQQLLAVTAGGQTMLLSGHVMPPKKLRALLPKPTSTGTTHVTMVPAAVMSDTAGGTTAGQKVSSASIPMQTQQEGGTNTIQPVPLPAVARTPMIINVTGSPLASTQSPKASPTVHQTVPQANGQPVDASIQKPTVEEGVKEEDAGDEVIPPRIKIEIDDPTYRAEKTEDPPATSQGIAPMTMTTTPTTNWSTVTPPPRMESIRRSEDHHPAERLTKSVSPQLLTSSSATDSVYRENHDVKGRAIQQFRLSKAIGRIVNARAQGQASRAPRKPSVVFHRPSSNSAPIPLQVRNELPAHSSSPRTRSSRAHTGLPAVMEAQRRDQTVRSIQRNCQMLRAARLANLRPGVHRLHPTNLWKGRKVVTNYTNQRRVAARMQQLVSSSPLYYQSDLKEDDLLPELEIDPPETHDGDDDNEDAGEAGGQASERPLSLNQDAFNLLMRQTFIDMTKQMRKMSQHMETIQGQLQVIVEFLPNLLPRANDSYDLSNSQEQPTTNGYQDSLSPQSNGDQSPDSDDGAGEISSPHQEVAMVLPKVGSPESDALIREVMDDGRWDQLTVYAGAPRLAISLARYCIFGTKVLMESSVTGRNSKNPLSHSAMKKIKQLLHEKYGHRCNEFEFEMVWKTSRESISQLCKRLRRKYQVSEGGQEDFVIDSRQ